MKPRPIVIGTRDKTIRPPKRGGGTNGRGGTWDERGPHTGGPEPF